MKIYQLIAAILFVVCYKFSVYFFPETPELPYIFMIPFILMVGIPHGATDHILENVVKYKKVSARISMPFLINYLTPMVVFGLMWWIFPGLSLIAFILISALHFGETQWENAMQNQIVRNPRWHKIMQYSWGLSLLSGLFLMFPKDFNYFTHNLTQNSSIELTTLVFSISLTLSISTWLIIAMAIVDKKTLMIQLFEFALILLLFYSTGLLVGFTVFFVFWHSVDAIYLQLSLIKKNIPSFDLKDFMRVAWPLSVFSVAGIGLLLYIVYIFDLPLITLLFIMISIITLPHHLAVEKFYAVSRSSK